MEFSSDLKALTKVDLPEYQGTRVMMLPFLLEDVDTLPSFLDHYRTPVEKLVKISPRQEGVGYLTVDEKLVPAGSSHRRSGLHVDGIYQGGLGGWGPLNPGGWAARGMVTVSNMVGCKAWNQIFKGSPGSEGECDHLQDQCRDEAEVILEPGRAYWMSGLCVHESLIQNTPVRRPLVRLSMPSDAPWFEGYTVNPEGIKPTGPILPRRPFMDE